MNMKAICAALLGLCLVCPSANAQERRLQFGPLHSGISVDEAVAALPQAEWVPTRGRASGVLVGARANAAVSFYDAVWDVSVGRAQEFGGEVSDERPSYENIYDLRFERDLDRASTRQCRQAFEGLLQRLETELGPFGQDPQFPDTRSRLYFNPYGPGMRVERVSQSRVRVWPRNGMQPIYTFREPTADFPYRTGVSLSIWDDNSCTLSFDVFQMPPPANSQDLAERGIGDAFERDTLPDPAARPSFAQPTVPITLPASSSLADVSAARGNLAAARDAARRTLGAYNEGAPGSRDLPSVNGYFALPAGEGIAGGVAYGRWYDADSGVGEPSRLTMLTFVTPAALCGGLVYWGNGSIADATYLGPAWLPEFEALDRDLRSGAAATAYPALPEGVTAGYVTPPNGADLGRFYPLRALAREIEGRVVLGCHVRPDHLLRCGVIEATPAEFAGGFASAAVRVFEGRVRVAESASNGVATAGHCLTRTVNFRQG